MSRPVLIWTFRRTGGTALARFLFALSPCKPLPDEALNPDRALGPLTTAWREGGDVTALRDGLAVLEGRCLKHALDTVPFPVSAALAERTRESHAHLLHLRLNETDRLISLHLARATGTWGKDGAAEARARLSDGRLRLPRIERKEIMEQEARDAATLGRFLRLTRAMALPLAESTFEAAFEGDERAAHLRSLAARLGLPDPDGAALERFIAEPGQDSAGVAGFIPNLAEIRAALDRQAGFPGSAPSG